MSLLARSFTDYLSTQSPHVASVSKYVTRAVVPHLVTLFLNPDEISNREPILASLAATLNAVRTAQKDDNQHPLLVPYKDEVLGVLTVGLKTPSTRKPALDGLENFILMKDLLSDEELGFIVHNVNEAMQSDDGGGNIDSCVLRHIAYITLIHSVRQPLGAPVYDFFDILSPLGRDHPSSLV